ncbi:lipopolysaccharide biosynthesis protein [Novosphingobium ginsenosidimutans]|uniref:Oligosaccharide flippase family protein n=1 Tax=Novosphingobium ginsenosidimutans TaxID=1176536 RepID=A0A5B8S5S3_9SPHN|nr:oligosaccharide flippase family protein [Novosphingobium ginsenosidimutans]QEA16097.1 oligosaccharide flippase family protein [Novosphingobium ginsenosidimutans]
MISFKRISTYVFAGFVAQGAAAIAGLLLVRWIPAAEYALYTIAVTMIGTISTLTRSGPQLGLSGALSEAWPDQDRAARALASALQIRLMVSAIVMPLVLVATAWLLLKAGTDWPRLAMIIGILALIWLADLKGGLLDQVLFFAQRANRVQSLDSSISIGRLVLVVGAKAAGQLSVIVALLTNLYAVAARIPALTRWSREALARTRPAEPDPAMQRAMRKVALRQIPIDLLTVLQAQLAIFFLTDRGGLFELATYGALGRIAQLLTPFSALVMAYFVPAFAGQRDRIVPRLMLFISLSCAPAVGLALVAWQAPEYLLVFIGQQYADQAWPLFVCALTLIAMGVANTLWAVVAHRGWNRWAWLRLPIGGLWCFIGPMVLSLDSAASTYLFYCGFSVGTLVSALADLVAARRRGEYVALFRRSPEPTAAPNGG